MALGIGECVGFLVGVSVVLAVGVVVGFAGLVGVTVGVHVGGTIVSVQFVLKQPNPLPHTNACPVAHLLKHLVLASFIDVPQKKVRGL